MTNLERRVAEAYERARNSPPVIVKADRNQLVPTGHVHPTDLQLAQMSLIGGRATTDIAKAVEREFLRGGKR